MKNYKEEIAEMLAKKAGIKKEDIITFLEVPPNQDLGDFAFPCFKLSAILKKNPIEIAKQLEKEIKPTKDIIKILAQNAYLNFFINKKVVIEDLFKKIDKDYGKSKEKKNKETIMIEFSQPNTHKAFHVGHIRGTSLGESLARTYEFLGDKVIRANYSGDTGMHIAKWIWCYLKYHSKEKLKDDESWIAGIYVDAVKRLAENEDFQKEVDDINKKIEEKSDKNINELWKKTRELSIKSWQIIYKELGTKFDVHYFESEVEKRGKEIAQDLVKKGIAKISDEATIMDLEDYGLSIWVLLRKDGTVLYSSKDLALAERKIKDYSFDRCIITSGDEQNLHFRQLFKTLELMNFKAKGKFEQIGYGMVRLPTGKMSSRTGDNILYSDFKEEVVDYAKQEIKKRFPELKDKEVEERALKIAIASMKYSMLSQDPKRSIIFNKEEAISFEGDTGPYLQYSYARASSIIKKSKESKAKLKLVIPENLEPTELALIKKIQDFPSIVESSAKHLNPALIANYSFQLSQIFNEFYHNCPVINSDKEAFRLKLVDSFRITLKNALYLLGIEVIEQM